MSEFLTLREFGAIVRKSERYRLRVVQIWPPPVLQDWGPDHVRKTRSFSLAEGPTHGRLFGCGCVRCPR